MATTSKANRKKKTKKKKVVRKAAAKPSEVKSVLDLEDLRQLENLSKDVQIAKMDMHLEEQSLRNMNLEFALMEQKIFKQRELMEAKAEIFKKKKDQFVEYKSAINPKYGLKEDESLGYNPDTGEIVR